MDSRPTSRAAAHAWEVDRTTVRFPDPAIESGVTNAIETYSTRGTDVTPFTEEATAENGTFLFPVTDYASQISSIMLNALENIFISDAEPEPTLTQANEQVNALFQ